MYKNTVIYSIIKMLKIRYIVYIYLIYQYKLCIETKIIQGKIMKTTCF